MTNNLHNTTGELESISGIIYTGVDPETGNIVRVIIDTRAEHKQLTIEIVDENGDRVPASPVTLLDIAEITTTKKEVRFRVLKFRDADDNCKRKRFTYIGTEPEDDV